MPELPVWKSKLKRGGLEFDKAVWEPTYESVTLDVSMHDGSIWIESPYTTDPLSCFTSSVKVVVAASGSFGSRASGRGPEPLSSLAL